MTEQSLVCIGNLTIDEAIHAGVNSGPAMGGDAAYSALAARLWLDDVHMLAPIGPDLPHGLLDDLSVAGVNTADLPTRDLPTVRNIIDYADDGSRTWHLQCSEEDFDRMSIYPEDVPAPVLAADGIVLLAMSLEAQLALTPWLREHSAATLYLDVQEDYLDGNLPDLHRMISCCDVFLPSEIEALALTGSTDLHQAARQLRDLGPETIVITRAERGVLLLTGDGPAVEIPVETVDPVDSTGAGDAFCGAFAAVHLTTGDPIAAIEAGATAARIAIGAFGINGLLDAATARSMAAQAVRR
ncbi:ribokinase [Nakamurella sp. UYEF19]|uniref:carbohydrate kinase family protein n=1 Tax=Nakamurella sp. UYEF19 TaxID=1756392 RepID=UPI0033942DFF